MTQKELTLFFVWCWFELLKKREANRGYSLAYRLRDPKKWADRQRRYYTKNQGRLSEYKKEWAAEHQEELSAARKKYHQQNRGRITSRMLAWVHNNRDRRNATMREYRAKRSASDPGFRMRHILATRLCGLLRFKGTKSASTLSLLGCSIEELKRHLQLQFRPGMSWDNYGEWHIDHKRPCASFDLADPEQQRACFNFSNLQPLWAVDNMRKGAKHAAQPCY